MFGGRRASGLLVVPDGAQLRHDVVEQSGIEQDQGLLHPDAPEAPFAFVSAPHLDHCAGDAGVFIAPPQVLLEQDVKAWRFTIANWNWKQNAYGYGPSW